MLNFSVSASFSFLSSTEKQHDILATDDLLCSYTCTLRVPYLNHPRSSAHRSADVSEWEKHCISIMFYIHKVTSSLKHVCFFILKHLPASGVLGLCLTPFLAHQRTIFPPNHEKHTHKSSLQNHLHRSLTGTVKTQLYLERSVQVLDLLPQHCEVFPKREKKYHVD